MNPKLLILLPALVLLAGCVVNETPEWRPAVKRCMEATHDRQYCTCAPYYGYKEYTNDH